MAGKPVGIVASGVYIPPTRLPLALVRGGHAREGGAQKAVAGFDEDAITMAVAAAVDCLHGIDRAGIDGLYFASTSSPFREKQGAALIATALDLRVDVSTVDFGGSLRAAAGALLAAVNAVRAEPGRRILVVAADCRLAAPRSPLEANLGDAAAAFLVGADAVLASLEAAFAHTDEILDVWRSEHDDYLRAWEDRFNVMHGYSDNLLAGCETFFARTGSSAADFDHAVLYAPDARSLAALARRLDLGAVQDGLFGRVGNCGAAFTPLLLATALEEAEAGQRLLVAFYGDGAEVLSLRVHAAARPRRGTQWYLDRGRALPSYDSYLKARQLDPAEHDPRGGQGMPATVHFRERDADVRFHGRRCTACGTLHFPACRVCYGCYAKDCFESVRLSDRPGRVLSYSFDYFFPSPEPPLVAGMCEVEGGARVYLQMTDASTDMLRCDLPVEFVFRKIHDAGSRPHYFWKSRPLQSDQETGA